MSNEELQALKRIFEELGEIRGELRKIKDKLTHGQPVRQQVTKHQTRPRPRRA